MAGKKASDPGSLLITLDEALRLLSINQDTLLKLRRMEMFGPDVIHITGTRKGIRFRRKEIEDWVEAGCPNRETWLARRIRNGK